MIESGRSQCDVPHSMATQLLHHITVDRVADENADRINALGQRNRRGVQLRLEKQQLVIGVCPVQGALIPGVG